MNRFLLGALATVSLLVLTSFALTRTSPPTTGPAWTVSQYQLDRAFRVSASLVGGVPLTSQVGPGAGFIITQITYPRLQNTVVTITINGSVESLRNKGNGEGEVQDFNPPIIVRPNDNFSFSANGNIDLRIAGYTTLTGET
jgi:hypothetical protein